MGDNIVLSDDATLHTLYDLDDRDVIVFTDAPMAFTLGAQVTISVQVLDRQQSNRGVRDLQLISDAAGEDCPHASPAPASPCNRAHGRPCTYPSGRSDCRRNIATCADQRWVVRCFE